MSLRARLLAGMVILVAAGLAVAAVATYAEQRSFLYDRVDQQVGSAQVPLSFALRLDRTPGHRAGSPTRALPPRPTVAAAPARRRGFDLPPGTIGEVIAPGGAVLRTRTFSYGQTAAPDLRLPAHYPIAPQGSTPHLFTLPAGSGADAPYRAEAFRDGGDTAVIAVPLRDAQATLHRLVIVELLVGGAVIVALIALAWFVIGLGLRPLARIGATASEIASGDLSRRVDPAGGRTEVGRLGRALNEMLGQIEAAFTDRARSEDRLRRFLADASHELRTPLTSIRGYAELFRMGAATDPDTLARAMARIEAEATRMGVLVEDLLLLAQLDQMPEPRRLSVDLTELVHSVEQDARISAGEHPITVSTAVSAAGALRTRGDPDQLRQVFGNLVRNAIIHTPEGTAIDVELWRAGPTAVVRVRDHGPGLPAGDPRQLFERFWRHGGGRRRGPGGSGLGLAIVQAIVEAHGGTVTAADAPGGGAAFVVTLPADVGDDSPPPAGVDIGDDPPAPARVDDSQESLSLLTPDSSSPRRESCAMTTSGLTADA